MTSVMDWALPPELSAAVETMDGLFAGAAPLGVAFSGGVDSSVLLALAVRALGAEQVVAILAVSPSLAQDDRRGAHEVAAYIGARLVELRTREGDRQAYRANGPDRCFQCKDELFTRISDEVVQKYGLAAVAYGENADDAKRPDRPGSRAATNHKVLRPLADAGLDKAAVRTIARTLRLPSAEKPAAPCLASRIPHFQEVTEAKLAQIETAEKALRTLGFVQSRVRHHGDVARIELATEDLERALSPGTRTHLHAAVAAAGFRFVTVDVLGIQSGAFTLSVLSSER